MLELLLVLNLIIGLVVVAVEPDFSYQAVRFSFDLLGFECFRFAEKFAVLGD